MLKLNESFFQNLEEIACLEKIHEDSSKNYAYLEKKKRELEVGMEEELQASTNVSARISKATKELLEEYENAKTPS